MAAMPQHDAMQPTSDPPAIHRWRALAWTLAGLLLLAPWIAMRFTDEVAWTALDFTVFGGMLLAALGTFEFAIRASRGLAFRAGVAMAVVSGFLLLWMNLAVGIIGSESEPANLMFAGVLATAAIGSGLARLRARGMAWAMAATAVAQLLVAAIAGAARLGDPATLWLLTGFYCVLWLTAAALFAIARSG